MDFNLVALNMAHTVSVCQCVCVRVCACIWVLNVLIRLNVSMFVPSGISVAWSEKANASVLIAAIQLSSFLTKPLEILLLYF